MKAYKLIAGAAAVLLTLGSLRAVLYDVDALQPIGQSHITPTTHVTNLAPVIVRPSAAEMRAAALMNDTASLGLMATSADSEIRLDTQVQPLSVLGSQLVMPYYSFGKKFGSITKE